MYSIKWINGSKRVLPLGCIETDYIKSIRRSIVRADETSDLDSLQQDENVERVDLEPDEEPPPPQENLVVGFDGAEDGVTWDRDDHWNRESDTVQVRWEENTTAGVGVVGLADGYSNSGLTITLPSDSGETFAIQSGGGSPGIGQANLRFYFRVGSYPVDNDIELVYELSNQDPQSELRCVLNSDGSVELLDVDGSQDISGASAIPTSQWVRLELQSGQFANDVCRVQIWTTSPEDLASPDIDLSYTLNDNKSQISRLFPAHRNNSTSSFDVDIDEVIYGDWGWIGPMSDRTMYSESSSSRQQQVGVVDAWDTTLGDSGLIIGHIDTGLNPSEMLPEERIRRDIGRDYRTDGDETNTYDRSSDQDTWRDDHGTKSGSAMVGDGRVRGVARQCQIAPFVVFNSQPGMNIIRSQSTATVLALERCVDLGVKIAMINIAVGDSQTLQDGIQYAYNNGMLLFAAGGNFSTAADPCFPAGYDEVIGVGVHDHTYEPSNQDRTPTEVTTRTGHLGMHTAGSTDVIGGTSGSTPFATGITALIWSAYSTFTREEVVQKLTEHAIADGWSEFGALDAQSALSEALPAPQNVQVLSSDASSVTIGWDAVTGADSYTVEKNGTILAQDVTNTQYTDNDPQYAFKPSYRVRAVTGSP